MATQTGMVFEEAATNEGNLLDLRHHGQKTSEELHREYPNSDKLRSTHGTLGTSHSNRKRPDSRNYNNALKIKPLESGKV